MKVTIDAAQFRITIDAPDGSIKLSGTGEGESVAPAPSPAHMTDEIENPIPIHKEHWKPGKCPGCGERLTRPGRWVIVGPNGLVHIKCVKKNDEKDEPEEEMENERDLEEEIDGDTEEETEEDDG